MNRRLLALLSGAAAAALVLVPAHPAAAASPFHGVLRGHWSSADSGPDAGSTYTISHLSGTTNIGSTGGSGTSGKLGFVREANCEMQLEVWTNSPRGLMKIHVRSKLAYPGGYDCRRYAFTYRILSGTGAYAGASGTGYGNVNLTNGTNVYGGPATLTFNS